MIERMRAVAVTFGSALLTLIVISNAYYQKRQFYPSVVYITKSNSSMAIIYLQAFVIVLLMGKLMRKLFFGQLRAAEMEHLIERSWYAVTETCLAFTVFRDDLSPKFVALFTLLLFLKCFHWLAEDRVDYMERSPNISLLFHIRVLSLLLLLGALDVQFVTIAYHITLTKGASVQLVFGFEYAILFTIILNIFIKYLLHRLDLRRDSPWENKAVYLLYTELLMGFLKVVLYLTFITIMMKIHTFPLFAIRPMYLSMRAFKKALNDVIMSRRAIRNMNTLYPNATQEELAAVDNVCIICREEMTGNGSAKKLPCNHIFHVSCLRSWFQRQQTCPTCRMDVLRNTPNANTVNQQQQQQQAAAAQPQQQIRQNQLPLQQQMLLFMNLMNALQQQQQQQQQRSTVPGAASGAQQQQQQTQENASTSQASTGISTATTTTAVSTATSSTTTTATSSSSTASTSSATLPPPFAMSFPFMNFVPPPPPPPPMPPSNLAQLSLDELRQMEGNERESLEARIRCLQSIKTLLDAAVTQLNQYNTIIMSSTHRNAPQTTVTNSTTTNTTPSTSSSSSATPLNQQQQAPTPAPPTATSSKIEQNSVDIASTSNDPKADIIRKRRLERFSQTNAPNIDDLVKDNATQSKQTEDEKKAT